MGKIIEIKNATKRFGGLVANEAVTFDVEVGRLWVWWDPTEQARPPCSTP